MWHARSQSPWLRFPLPPPPLGGGEDAFGDAPSGELIQFAMSAVRRAGAAPPALLITYGVNECASRALTVTIEAIRRQLRPVPQRVGGSTRDGG